MITATYAIAARRPINVEIAAIDIAFTAGPVIRKTNAAPGERPFTTNAAAIGMAAVEHTHRKPENGHQEKLKPFMPFKRIWQIRMSQ